MSDGPITIDAEFHALIPALTSEEHARLEANVLEDGCIDPLVCWQHDDQVILLDGHNRYGICTEHGVPFLTHLLDLPDREAAKTWIIYHQFGRRNLALYQRAELALLLEPLIADKAKAKQVEGGEQKLPQNSAEAIETREEVAKAAGVSHDTIARTKYLQEHADEDTQAKLRTGETSINREYIKAKDLTPPHIARATGENEWYTPPKYIEAARAVMGGIDCDPASSKIANRTVKATTFYTKDDSGLGAAKLWGDRVWMNPPYAQPLIAQFAAALVARVKAGEVKQACVLVNNATETDFFQSMLAVARAVCLPKGRIKFLNADGRATGAPLQGQAILYVGPDGNFADIFGELGVVLWVG